MGDLISMTRSASTFVARPHTGGDAEILFFTGVRYYRIEDETPVATPTRSRRRSEKDPAREALQPHQQV